MATTESLQPTRVHVPLRLDTLQTVRRSLDVSPSRSSTNSNSSYSKVHTPSSSVPNTPLIPTRPPSPEERPSHPAESNTFLTVLAAQERRVFELKEELQKAESDLQKLKRQWEAHEVVKKRNELRRLEPLQPLACTLAVSTVSQEGDLLRSIRGRDRRDLALSSARASQRKVFSGSRHTRTLSLLSPKEPMESATSLPNVPVRPSSSEGKPNNIHVPPTISESSRTQRAAKIPGEIHRSPDKDAIFESGRQLVGDFRQGLWTFFEDLKQVTVGEEVSSSSDRTIHHQPGHLSRAVTTNNGASIIVEDTTTRLAKPTPSPGRTQQKHRIVPISIESSFKPLAQVKPGMSTEPRRSGLDNIQANDATESEDDGWDNWDSPGTK
ncbi:MAG: hypothetical protein Q9217_005715 [Psora testacea]